MAEEHAQIVVSDDSDLDDCVTPELRGILSKWTNYIHGWQDRFIVLKDGTLSYYKSELESNLGCRGALSLLKANVKPHEFDECRFDVSVNDCVWYMRAGSAEERQQWVDVLETFKGESGYGTSSDSSSGGAATSGLRRHGSVASLQSAGSSGRAGRRLAERVSELETYAELLGKQADVLQRYFDACVAGAGGVAEGETVGGEDGVVMEAIDAVHLAEASVHASEVRGCAHAFRATCSATSVLLQQCVELLRRRERALSAKALAATKRAKEAEDMCVALREQLQEARIASFPGPDLEEGPHSTLPDDEFYDAVETGLDKIEEECASRPVARDDVQLPQPQIDTRLMAHRLWPEIERITTEQLAQAFQGVGGEGGWQLFAEEGEMRMYRREQEIDGMVVDPLRAMHKVRGVSGRELCHYFFNPQYRHDWEAALETMTIVEAMSTDATIFHQSFKRVWPASQRDALFWSHVRVDGDTWSVVNHSTDVDDYPPNLGKCIRVFLTVCLACRTEVEPPAVPGAPPSRDNITTSIAYCSTINPGGWAPAGVLRAVYKREYPKFLKRFTQYVHDQCRDKPLAL